jgi:hypothetical protein
MNPTPLHLQPWRRSESGRSIRTSYGGLHVSIWRRPQVGPLRFTISGTFPADITSTREAMTALWDLMLQHVQHRRAA